MADSEDLLDVVRTELDLANSIKPFPKKGTCLTIYSRVVIARQPLALDERASDGHPRLFAGLANHADLDADFSVGRDTVLGYV